MKKRAFGKLYKELFYIPKHAKLTEKVFRCRMITLLLTMLACTAVLITSTWAWFNMSVTTQILSGTSACYSVSVDNAESGIYICPLTAEDKHTFVITAGGTATTGYCKIQVGESTYYTEQIAQGQSLDLTVYAAKDTVITFTPAWGTLSNFTDKSPENPINHSATPSTTYTVEPTVRLSSIAAHYGVTEEDILIYNNLLLAIVAEEDTTPLLTVGMELKIPNPAENVEPYKVPYATYIVEPTASLDAISAHYGIPIEDIIAFNDMTTYGVGMSLKIPNADPYLPDYAVPYATYIVEPTATLEGISEYYGISVVDIVTYNGFVDMTAGNVIKIPGVSPDTPSYVAPIPEPPASTDENSGDNTQGDNIAPPVVEDTVSGGDVGTGEQQPPQELVSEELAVLYPNDNDYYLISGSTITLKNADILIYKGHEYETVESYQKDLDRRITGIEAVADINNKTGEYFCELLTNAETLSLCLEITENIGLGYLKIIIGESEYYTVQLKKDAYIRLDIVAPIGTEIRFEAYEGVPVADTLYGDDLKNDTDGNNPLLNHTWLISQNVEPVAPIGESADPITEDNTVSGCDTTPTEQPTVETPTEVTTPPDETSATEQPMEETPDPEDITSNRESDGGEEPAEEPAPAGDEPTDTGATE